MVAPPKKQEKRGTTTLFAQHKAKDKPMIEKIKQKVKYNKISLVIL